MTSDDRWRWGQRGLTLTPRDYAAARLVRDGEAEYTTRVLALHADLGPVIHLAARLQPEPDQ